MRHGRCLVFNEDLKVFEIAEELLQSGASRTVRLFIFIPRLLYNCDAGGKKELTAAPDDGRGDVFLVLCMGERRGWGEGVGT